MSINEQSILNSYQKNWEEFGSVRSRPRKMLKTKDCNGYFYPISRQPLCIHPEINRLGEAAKEFILLQSLYKYSNDIALIETKVVNDIVLKIAHNELSINFDFIYKINAMTVAIDETYHAYVALDCLNQLAEHTQLKPLPLPSKTSLGHAMNETKKTLNKTYHPYFDLIAICIAENTITKEIISLRDNEDTNDFFKSIICDHLVDERRHSGFFFLVLKQTWSEFDHEIKKQIALAMPTFLKNYLDNDIQKKFDRSILEALNISPKMAKKIIEDTHTGFAITKNHPTIINIVHSFAKANILDNEAMNLSLNKAGLL